MDALERLISTATELGAAQAMVNLGLTAGEISQRKAGRIYGTWFTDAAAAGRIFPCRVEDGRAGTRWYSITEILKLKTYDAARAELKNL
jgi:hypothetical protein